MLPGLFHAVHDRVERHQALIEQARFVVRPRLSVGTISPAATAGFFAVPTKRGSHVLSQSSYLANRLSRQTSSTTSESADPPDVLLCCRFEGHRLRCRL